MHPVSPTLVRLTLTYGRRSTLVVIFLPVIRPSTLFSLLVSRLERPTILRLYDTATRARGINRLIMPDRTRAAARVAGRVVPLGLILLLPARLTGLFMVAANARRVPELRVFKLFAVLAILGIGMTLVTLLGDLGPLIPLPNYVDSGINRQNKLGRELDLSRQDLPRIALLRRGEMQDLLFRALAYSVFVTICAQGLLTRQKIASR